MSGLAVRVIDLKPGDKIMAMMAFATFISQGPHPLFPGLQLVVWYMGSPTGYKGERSYSFDAVSLSQEVGFLVEQTEKERAAALREALGIKG